MDARVRSGNWLWLFRRWDTPSKVIATGVFIILVVCNIPGQATSRLSIGRLPLGAGDIYDLRLEHGWPATFLVRADTAYGVRGEGRTIADCWAFWKDPREFRVGSLLLNAATIAFIAVIVGHTAKLWRCRPIRPCQISLSTLLGAVCIACAILAWYGHKSNQYRAERRVLDDEHYRKCDVDLAVGNFRYGGITWLRISPGGSTLCFLDRVKQVCVNREGLATLEVFKELEAVEVFGPVTQAQLDTLSAIKGLKVLDLHSAVCVTDTGARGASFELPQLPRLLSLSVGGGQLRDAWSWASLARLNRLESLDASECVIDNRAVQFLSRLPVLETLVLNDTDLRGIDLSALESASSLHSLSLSGAKVDKQVINHVGELTQLEELALDGTSIRANDVKQLLNCYNLRRVDLAYTCLDESALEHLSNFPRLVEINLRGASATGESLRRLTRLASLRKLNVREIAVARRDIEALRAALPTLELEYDAIPTEGCDK